MFHLIDADYKKLKQYKQEAKFKQSNYTGINPRYFDSRMAEMKSLMDHIKGVPDIEFFSWKKL